MTQKSPQRERTRGYSLWGDCVSNHLKMLQCFHDCILFFLRTLGLLRIFIFRFMVILSLDIEFGQKENRFAMA